MSALLLVVIVDFVLGFVGGFFDRLTCALNIFTGALHRVAAGSTRGQAKGNDENQQLPLFMECLQLCAFTLRLERNVRSGSKVPIPGHNGSMGSGRRR